MAVGCPTLRRLRTLPARNARVKNLKNSLPSSAFRSQSRYNVADASTNSGGGPHASAWFDPIGGRSGRTLSLHRNDYGCGRDRNIGQHAPGGEYLIAAF